MNNPPADAAVLNDRTTKILRYISAYNNQDVENMMADLAEEIQFININDGSISMHLHGMEAFKNQANEALSYFSERQQTIESLSHQSASSEIRISYSAIAAIDLPNGMKKGDAIKLKGRSVFEFDKDGKIYRLTDIA